eukprot:TRINITY_DN4152_c0_g1_i1.p1 TRINITY_DN4152_c0_g1~~TRINITY_DN4152_c0_g1_i1.p1  ORF type:complete len:332 (-),score=29.19 TRINITY_DN4152_c0_g1_i1:242-1237(-)
MPICDHEMGSRLYGEPPLSRGSHTPLRTDSPLSPSEYDVTSRGQANGILNPLTSPLRRRRLFEMQKPASNESESNKNDKLWISGSEIRDPEVLKTMKNLQHLHEGQGALSEDEQALGQVLLKNIRYHSKLKPASDSFVCRRGFLLYEIGETMKTVVIELDDVLLKECPPHEAEHTAVVTDTDGSIRQISFRTRPYARELLKKLRRAFEVIVFTRRKSDEAQALLQFFDPLRTYVSALIHESQCLITKNNIAVKDLRVFRNRSLDRMILVDSAHKPFPIQLSNFVPLSTWERDEDDCELIYLMRYLQDVARSQSVPARNEDNLRLTQIQNAL